MLVTMYLESSLVAGRNILPPKGSKQLVNFGSALLCEIAAFRSRTLVAELLERAKFLILDTLSACYQITCLIEVYEN
jgi:hypothetical protein